MKQFGDNSRKEEKKQMHFITKEKKKINLNKIKFKENRKNYIVISRDKF